MIEQIFTQIDLLETFSKPIKLVQLVISRLRLEGF